MRRPKASTKFIVRSAKIFAPIVVSLMAVAPARSRDIDMVLFGSLDAETATFLNGGAKLGFGPLAEDGFVVLASLGGGRRAERDDFGRPRTRYTFSAAAVLGYQWSSEWGTAALFAGPEGSMDMVLDPSALNTLPAAYGLRLHGEVWVRPTVDTLVQGTAIVGSTRDSLWARAAWGYRVWSGYLGPEAGFYGDATGYRKWNLGLHATDFALGRYSLRISAGLQSESGRRRPFPYLALAVWSPW